MTDATDPKHPQPSTREIRGDIGVAGGDIHQDGNLNVGGTIRDGMDVKVVGELKVGGSIEVATVHASKSITVAGNIVGRGKGSCTSGGTISVRIANGTTMEASEDIVAALEIVSCRVIAGHSLKCEEGSIHGGHITANGGIVCSVLGSPGEMVTLVEVGIDERLRRLGKTRAAEISRNLQRIFKIKSEIGPLLAQQRALTAKQKETATELLYDASEQEEKTESLIRDVRRLVAAVAAYSKPEVLVAKTLHAGVTIRFKGVQTKITSTIEGPVKLWAKPLGHSYQIVMTDMENGATQPMESQVYLDADLIALQQAIAERQKLAA